MNENDIFLGKISEIEKAIESELYNCALALALTLPDVCGKVECTIQKSIKNRPLVPN